MSTRRGELFELRSYLAQPGRRDELIGMFESIFLDAYQAGGARIVGTFRSLDEPDRWVWMRAFPDAASRGPALKNFYGGDVWKRNADACNATIADIDEARLLREVSPGSLGSLCAPRHESPLPQCMYELAVTREMPAGPVGVVLVTDHSENSYPRQPVSSQSVYVTLTRFDSATRPASRDAMRLAPTARSALR